MKITPVYENQVFVVPQDKVCRRLSTATREELAVLLSVLADPVFTPSDRASALNLTEKTFLDALAVWQREGVLAITETGDSTVHASAAEKAEQNPGRTPADADSARKTPAKKNMHARRELPHYAAADAADYLEHHEEIKSLVDCCQNISGDMFSTAETEILIGMHDYLALSPEYIMLLFAHAKKLGKKSVRYVETLAIRFFDEGVTGYKELEERLQTIEKVESAEQYIRKLFGMNGRALIAKEKAMVEKWILTMHYDRPIIEKAYEVTISNTGKPSVSYANAVLENWYKAGLGTLEEIEASIAEYQKNREDGKNGEGKPEGTSFDTDDFFAAALRRSYGDE
ncbi:MAG: DnaD domain protein [Ruminococcaceae bacterium]|nr:DnaD domain protein [Oscillospiraceae bacterium]